MGVSSRESWAYRLTDGTSSYWQSCGTQGKHWIRLELHPDVLIHSLRIQVSRVPIMTEKLSNQNGILILLIGRPCRLHLHALRHRGQWRRYLVLLEGDHHGEHRPYRSYRQFVVAFEGTFFRVYAILILLRYHV